MRLLALALALLLAGCSAKVTVPLAAGADLATTHMALERGYVEGNPLFRGASFGEMAAWKLAGVGLILWVCAWLDDHGYENHSDVLQWTATGLWGGAAAWNAHKILEAE